MTCQTRKSLAPESVETVREIVEEARAVKPLDSSLNYACRYTKLSQELLECVIGTCPKNFNERDNKAPSTPVTRKKQVTFSDKPGTSSSNTQKQKVHQRVQLTNIPVLSYTGVNDSTDARRPTEKETYLGKHDCGSQWIPTGTYICLMENANQKDPKENWGTDNPNSPNSMFSMQVVTGHMLGIFIWNSGCSKHNERVYYVKRLDTIYFCSNFVILILTVAFRKAYILVRDLKARSAIGSTTRRTRLLKEKIQVTIDEMAQTWPPDKNKYTMSTTIAQDANRQHGQSLPTSDRHLPIQHQEIPEDTPIIHDVPHPSHNLVPGDPGSAQSSSGNDKAVEPNHDNYPPDHIRRWTKDHPLDNSDAQSLSSSNQNIHCQCGNQRTIIITRLDVKTFAFLNGDLQEEYLLSSNLKIEDQANPTRLIRLKKALNIEWILSDPVDTPMVYRLKLDEDLHGATTKKHFEAIKRVFRYLKGTIHMGLWYPKDNAMSLTAYADADHAGCQDSRRSTSGSAQFLGDRLVSWSSKKQRSTAISTTEAEYIAMSWMCGSNPLNAIPA
ncbi:hypothetical protein Tco_0278477 [Tanacetum coccineum]